MLVVCTEEQPGTSIGHRLLFGHQETWYNKEVERPKSSRIVTLDLMRGYFLIAIILNHLAYYPNGFDWFTARGDLYVSSAEGFFFISGLVLGIVRGRKLMEQPLSRVTKLLLSRSFQIYMTSIILLLIFTLFGWWFFLNNPGLKFGIRSPDTDIWQFLWQVISLQYFYGWADYLRLYAMFLLASPLAIWLLRRGQWHYLLLGSMGVWLLYPSNLNLHSPYEVKQLFQPLSWQLLFFGGMIVGFYWQYLIAWWQDIPLRYRRVITITILGLAVITLAANLILVFAERWHLSSAAIIQQYNTWLHVTYFDKERLAIFRIMLFLVWFWASFWLFYRFEGIIRRWLGWLLESFGTNSLYVYTLHAFAIFFVHLFIAKGSLWMNFLTAAGIILAIRLAIHYRLLMGIIPR